MKSIIVCSDSWAEKCRSTVDTFFGDGLESNKVYLFPTLQMNRQRLWIKEKNVNDMRSNSGEICWSFCSSVCKLNKDMLQRWDFGIGFFQSRCLHGRGSRSRVSAVPPSCASCAFAAVSPDSSLTKTAILDRPPSLCFALSFPHGCLSLEPIHWLEQQRLTGRSDHYDSEPCLLWSPAQTCATCWLALRLQCQLSFFLPPL